MDQFEVIQRLKTGFSKPRILFILYNGMGSITSRVRGLIYGEPLRELGWIAEFVDIEDVGEEQIVEIAVDFDIVYLLKIPFIGLIQKLRHHTKAKLIFDLTDALWMPHHRWNKWQDLETILAEVDAIFSDNRFVAAYGSKFNTSVHIIPPCTQVERFDEIRNTLPARNDDHVVIGWVGTASTINALHVIKDPLERIFSRHPNLHLRLLILGFSNMGDLPDFKYVRFSILPKYDEDDMIREVLQMDIGLFPPPCGLEDYAIRGILKALVYMTGGVPPVCENGGECSATLIQNGINGMLASGPDEWEQKLEYLIASPHERKRIGQNALATVRKVNSLKAITECLAKAFQKVLYEQSRKTRSFMTLAEQSVDQNQTDFCSTGIIPKRVLIACSHFWPSIGGVENRVEQFSVALVEAGYEVTVITPDFPERTSSVRNGVQILSIDPSSYIDGIPAWPVSVRYTLMSGDFNVCILIQDPLGDIIWSVEGVILPPSVRLIIQPIINADGYSKWKDNEQFGPRLAGILKNATSVVAMTKAGPENYFMRQHGIKPMYIPNASSIPEPAGDFRARYAIPADRFVILHVANLYWVKNHIGLLESLKEMPESWLLVMVGNPSGEPDCAQKVWEALSGRPDVLYIPGLSREWVSSAMQAADVIVLSSFGEGSPNTILEAMAHGKPWMATPQCGAANDHAGGIISELTDFRDYLSILNSSFELRQLLGDMGRRHWQSCLSWPRVVDGWIDLIETGSLHETFEMPVEIKEIMENINRLIAILRNQRYKAIFSESMHAHHWLDGLQGLEIGPSAHNPFGLNVRYVGICDEIYEEEQIRLTGSAVVLDIEALADNILLPDESEDFILSSHVIEHCPNVITTLLEWFRIIRKGGVIYMITPLPDAARSDVGREITSWCHILDDFNRQANEHSEPEAGRFGHCHYHVFDITSMREIVWNIFGDRLQLVDSLERDDKIGNGFTLVYRKMVDNNEVCPWEFWSCFTSRRNRSQIKGQEDTVFVNIGITTFNRLEFTTQVIEALLLKTDFPYVLTVVDNASTDGTRGYLREQKSRGVIKNLFLLDENVGVAKASNLAWSSEPQAAYYLKLDNDIVVQKDKWLTKMVEVADVVSEAGAVAYNFEPVSYPEHELHGIRVRPKNGNLGGACVLVPKKTHDLLGYWCEDYGLYGEEDADYGFRIMQAGLLNVYMLDEDMGVHLPAGKAAAIDPLTMRSFDGGEEQLYADYRAWKDDLRRTNVLSGYFAANLGKYAQAGGAIYCNTTFVAEWKGEMSYSTQKADKISIIIPVFNQAVLTRKCLDSLLSKKQDEVEIIVVDNGSVDWVPEYLASLGRAIKLISNQVNQGFAKACNQGAAVATGQYLVFLNNDTVPQASWLDALLAPAVEGKADIVGAKLLYPDGTIQHAGVVFDAQGPRHCYKRMSADTAEANQPRYLQAITAACMLISAELFQQLGGFDEGYKNGFEDVDLCLSAVQRGCRVYYQPASVLIHHEESSEGRKQYDEENYARFLRRWLGRWRIDYKQPPPLVSVIIPVFNQLSYTKSCLSMLFFTIQHIAELVEVIVVNNGSDDGTSDYLRSSCSDIRVVNHQDNLGFSKGCNSGAMVAKGQYLVFLNNDTEPCDGWLEALLAVFEQEQRVGVVGSKLLFPDGTIQHAGVAVVRDPYLPAELSPCHIGYQQSDAPEFNLLRECQAVTAACMIMPKTLFDQVGGFDEEYWNGFEDIDLCFKVFQAGYRIMYQPLSVVIHHESKSGKTRKEAELKNLQRLQNCWSGRIRPEFVRISLERVEPLAIG